MIDEPNRSACLKLYHYNLDRFQKAKGSSHNHHAWKGGYHDHVAEVMNICMLLYPVYNGIRPLNFTLADALLVMFLHDLEKPWKNRVLDVAEKVPIKLAKRIVRRDLINAYNITLTE